jgi:hypothetical protein
VPTLGLQHGVAPFKIRRGLGWLMVAGGLKATRNWMGSPLLMPP